MASNYVTSNDLSVGHTCKVAKVINSSVIEHDYERVEQI